MPSTDLWRERFARQVVMDVIGEEGQRHIAEAVVTVVGAGALGSNSAELLVRMGIGRVRIIDLDAKEREWEPLGEVTRSGPLLTLDRNDVRLQLFPSGRALVKGTSEKAVAKTLYARYWATRRWEAW